MQRTSSKTKADNFYTSFSNDEKKSTFNIKNTISNIENAYK